MSREAGNDREFDVTQKKQDLKDSLYYQNLQKALASKNERVKSQAADKKEQPHKTLPDIQDSVELHSQRSLFNWKTIKKSGQTEYELDVGTGNRFATSVLTSEKSMGIISVLGLRIDLQEKMQKYIDKYVKSYVQSRSHNLMIAKFAQFNVAFIGQILSLLGMSSSDIHKLQKRALQTAVEENMQLFAENEYNSELIAIVGGGTKKEIKAQQGVISELRTQLVTQMDRLDNKGYYSETKIKEIQVEQLKKIITSFYEEKTHLEFQLNYLQ